MFAAAGSGPRSFDWFWADTFLWHPVSIIAATSAAGSTFARNLFMAHSLVLELYLETRLLARSFSTISDAEFAVWALSRPGCRALHCSGEAAAPSPCCTCRRSPRLGRIPQAFSPRAA
jgi:hypothetical protein